MRLFTHISFMTTLLAVMASALVALIAVLFFECSPVIIALVVPIGCITYFLSLAIAHFISQPLKDLDVKIARYREGDRSIDFSPTGQIKEVDDLSAEFSDYISVYEARINELTTLKNRQNEFVSDVAHEFRTPLTAISGNAELMLDPDMPQSTREHFCEIILTESERLKKLTNNLLALQHAQEGAAPSEIKRLNMKTIANEVVDMLEPLAQDKDVTLSVEGEAPDILGTADRLKQALINLVDNAIRHVEVGGNVRVILSGLQGQAIVAVKDDGCGFGDIDPELLFKRFYRTDSSRARNSGGAGLGLAITKEIVDNHDGTITAINAPEGGATFIMAFPAIQ